MNQRRTSTKLGLLPEQNLIVNMLKQYGDALFEPCPSSEQIVLYCEDRTFLSDQDNLSIQKHLTVCLDCQDKVGWLMESEDAPINHCSETLAVLSLPVNIEPRDRVHEDHPLAYAAQSWDFAITTFSPIPYIESQDGSVRAEIGQDLDDRLFIDFQKLPILYHRSAVQVRALTKDMQVLETRSTSLTVPKIIIAKRADITPEDFTSIELCFTRLRPR